MSGNWNRKPELTGTSKAHTHFSIRTYAHSTLHLTWSWRQFNTCFFVTPNVWGQSIYTVFRCHQLSPGYQWPCSCHIGSRAFDLEPWTTPPHSGLRVGGEAVTPTPGGSARRPPTHFRCISSGNSNLRRSVLTPSKLSPLPTQRQSRGLPHPSLTQLTTLGLRGHSEAGWGEALTGLVGGRPHGRGQAPPRDATGRRPPGWASQCCSQVLRGPMLEVSNWII